MSGLLKLFFILSLCFCVNITIGFSTPLKIIKATTAANDYDSNEKNQNEANEFDENIFEKLIYFNASHSFNYFSNLNKSNNIFFFDEQFKLTHHTTPPFRPPTPTFKIS